MNLPYFEIVLALLTLVIVGVEMAIRLPMTNIRRMGLWVAARQAVRSFFKPEVYEVYEANGCMGIGRHNVRTGTKVCLFNKPLQPFPSESCQFIRLRFEDGTLGEFPFETKDMCRRSHSTFYYDAERDIYSYGY